MQAVSGFQTECNGHQHQHIIATTSHRNRTPRRKSILFIVKTELKRQERLRTEDDATRHREDAERRRREAEAARGRRVAGAGGSLKGERLRLKREEKKRLEEAEWLRRMEEER